MNDSYDTFAHIDDPLGPNILRNVCCSTINGDCTSKHCHHQLLCEIRRCDRVLEDNSKLVRRVLSCCKVDCHGFCAMLTCCIVRGIQNSPRHLTGSSIDVYCAAAVAQAIYRGYILRSSQMHLWAESALEYLRQKVEKGCSHQGMWFVIVCFVAVTSKQRSKLVLALRWLQSNSPCVRTETRTGGSWSHKMVMGVITRGSQEHCTVMPYQHLSPNRYVCRKAARIPDSQ